MELKVILLALKIRKWLLDMWASVDPCLNLLKPTCYVMHHHQFNIQQLYALHILYLCVLYLSEIKQ